MTDKQPPRIYPTGLVAKAPAPKKRRSRAKPKPVPKDDESP